MLRFISTQIARKKTKTKTNQPTNQQKPTLLLTDRCLLGRNVSRSRRQPRFFLHARTFICYFIIILMQKRLSQGLLFGWMSWSETPRAAADIMNDCVVKLRMWMMKNFERLWNLWITKVATVPKISPFVLHNKRRLKGLCLTKWFKNRIRKELRVISTGTIQQANCVPK